MYVQYLKPQPSQVSTISTYVFIELKIGFHKLYVETKARDNCIDFIKLYVTVCPNEPQLDRSLETKATFYIC